MKYLVMECHPGYAVVMDEKGRFLQVANQHFEVGQTVQTVIQLQPARQSPSARQILRNAAAVAACLCLLILASWNVLMPYGTVRMQINPDVKLSVNRLNYVIEIIPLNQDAKILLEGYDPGIQKVDQVLDALADRAAEMGYLSNSGDIRVTVESTHQDWQTATQDRLIAALAQHIGGSITVTPNTEPIPSAGNFDSYVKPKLSLEDVKQLVFRHLGITDSSALTDESYDYEDGIFELEFTCGGFEYEVTVDGRFGDILEIEKNPVEDPDDDDIDDPDDPEEDDDDDIDDPEEDDDIDDPEDDDDDDDDDDDEDD